MVPLMISSSAWRSGCANDVDLAVSSLINRKAFAVSGYSLAEEKDHIWTELSSFMYSRYAGNHTQLP
jgi:hypothetical protein